MSQIVLKDSKLDIYKIFNAIKETRKILNTANYKNNSLDILRAGKLITMVSPDILEQIIFDKSLKNILQITEQNIMDLNTILDDRSIDTIERSNFNNSKYKPPINKKYDCIVLFFSFDMTSKQNKLIQFCSRVLNEHGTLIVTSINPKNIIFVSELLCNGDFSGLIDNKDYINPSNINNFVDFIKNYNFIPKKIVPFNFPDKEYFNETQKNVYDNLKKYDLRDEEVLVFAYTSVFRKKVRRLVL
jgi:SAM-dependent methyltransferase